ncbi:MAG: hypothetical protein ACKVIN_09150, partial [Longimicrobiales bacterium]
LEETARDLQQTAESMRQSAASSGSQGSADATSALRGLEEARRELQQARSDRARRDAEDAIADVEELQQQQREVQRDVRDLPTERGPERQAEIDRLRERKEQMNDVVQDLEQRLDGAASSGQADNPQAARALAEAATQIRESKLKEKLQYTRGTIEQWDPESAVTMELQIEGDLQALRDQLERALNASSERAEDPLQEALDDTRDLVRGMEAMDRRLNEPGQGEGQQGQQGQGEGEGEQGEGEQGEGEGQQGQGEGQQGQGQGEQGQGEEQQGQGQRGQRGDANRLGGGGGGANDGWASDRSEDPFGNGAVRGNPRQFSAEEIRQYQSELRERSEQVMDLRSELDEVGMSTQDLDEVLALIRRFQDDELFSDPEALASLSDDMLNRLQRLEFGLRRDVEGEADRRATLTGADEVPDGYRRLVEEYYRALARGGSGPGGGR